MEACDQALAAVFTNIKLITRVLHMLDLRSIRHLQGVSVSFKQAASSPVLYSALRIRCRWNDSPSLKSKYAHLISSFQSTIEYLLVEGGDLHAVLEQVWALSAVDGSAHQPHFPKLTTLAWPCSMDTSFEEMRPLERLQTAAPNLANLVLKRCCTISRYSFPSLINLYLDYVIDPRTVCEDLANFIHRCPKLQGVWISRVDANKSIDVIYLKSVKVNNVTNSEDLKFIFTLALDDETRRRACPILFFSIHSYTSSTWHTGNAEITGEPMSNVGMAIRELPVQLQDSHAIEETSDLWAFHVHWNKVNARVIG